jgi:hypothetical protein
MEAGLARPGKARFFYGRGRDPAGNSKFSMVENPFVARIAVVSRWILKNKSC